MSTPAVKLPDSDVKDFEKIMNEINAYMDYHKDHYTEPVIKDLAQFHKSWFYNNWLVRFRHLNAFTNLGARGVLAIPNTTFEEWLWWFHEWAEALTDDYNDFKKMVYEALQLIQKHLEEIDRVLEDHERRITKLEKEVEEIKKQIAQIKQDINNLGDEISNVKQDVTHLGDQITNLQNQQGGTAAALDKLLEQLKNIGVWQPGADGSLASGNFKPGMGIAAGNINFFGGAADGSAWIRTNSGSTENDVTAGI